MLEQNEFAFTRPNVKNLSLRSGVSMPPPIMDVSVEYCKDRIYALENHDGWNQRENAAMWAGEAVPKAFESPGRLAHS